jgi:hypothetical protein
MKTSSTRSGLIILMIFGLSMSVGCGDDSSRTPSPTVAEQGEGATAPGPEDEGGPIDVVEFLQRQGFSTPQLSAIETNAAYWLLPFGMSRQPGGEPTCIFSMVNVTHNGEGAYAGHPIRANSTVKLEAVQVDGAGERGNSLTEEVELPFSELTPAWFASQDRIDLSSCGNTTLLR